MHIYIYIIVNRPFQLLTFKELLSHLLSHLSIDVSRKEVVCVKSIAYFAMRNASQIGRWVVIHDSWAWLHL